MIVVGRCDKKRGHCLTCHMNVKWYTTFGLDIVKSTDKILETDCNVNLALCILGIVLAEVNLFSWSRLELALVTVSRIMLKHRKSKGHVSFNYWSVEMWIVE